MINRRKFLQSSSACIALPLFASSPKKPFKRLLCMSNPFGMIPSGFYPKESGPLTNLPDTLKSLTPFIDKITIFKNLDHSLSGGHSASEAVFSGILRKEAKGRADGNISIDQKAALHNGHLTRLPYINAHLGRGAGFGDLSYWTKEGIPVRPYATSQDLFSKLFIQEDKKLIQQKTKVFNTNQSILDTVMSDISSFKKQLNKNDQGKLSEYTESVRAVEKRLQQDQSWLAKAKPSTSYKLPKKQLDFSEPSSSMLDMIALAFETDSTRIATLGVSGRSGGRDTGLHSIYHHASHHGNENENVSQLLSFEKVQMNLLARLLHKLNSTQDRLNGGTLLDNTLILFACGMSNPSSHDNTNLPVMVIGGGLQHKGFVECPEKNHRTPLSNLLLSSINYLGIKDETFGRSTGTFSHLKMV
ncbi:MAG: DUF1552 domain-containing protein [Lentisphaeraceae bacterium]|nr:DUF1552 domain-containing protein [Lentisphaeraceae bacterium]